MLGDALSFNLSRSIVFDKLCIALAHPTSPCVILPVFLFLQWARMGHGCFRSHSSRQYRSAIFYLNDKQKEEAEKKVQTLKACANGRCVHVDVESARPFYRAEKYHQHYLAKARRKPRSSGGKGLFF
jgi:hypothetical protein